MTVNRQGPHGARGQGLSGLRENGGQPTSLAWMQACHTLGSHQAFSSANHPTGNAATKRVLRTLTEECLWLTAWGSPCARSSAQEAWSAYDTTPDWPSTLGDKTPRPCARAYHSSPSTPFGAA
jgi:hypothetical protein